RVELVQFTSLCHKVASKFFAKNALDPPHWNQTHVLEHFVVFRCIWQCFVATQNLVQLMDKFVPLSRIGIFRNERIRSTPLDPKLKYWFVSYCFGAFWICFVTARNSVQNRLNWCN